MQHRVILVISETAVNMQRGKHWKTFLVKNNILCQEVVNRNQKSKNMQVIKTC